VIEQLSHVLFFSVIHWPVKTWTSDL